MATQKTLVRKSQGPLAPIPFSYMDLSILFKVSVRFMAEEGAASSSLGCFWLKRPGIETQCFLALCY